MPPLSFSTASVEEMQVAMDDANMPLAHRKIIQRYLKLSCELNNIHSDLGEYLFALSAQGISSIDDLTMYTKDEMMELFDQKIKMKPIHQRKLIDERSQVVATVATGELGWWQFSGSEMLSFLCFFNDVTVTGLVINKSVQKSFWSL